MTNESPYEVLTAYQKSAAVMAAAQCGLFEALSDGAQSGEALAKSLSLNGYATVVLLDALVTCGYLEQNESGLYELNDFSREFTTASESTLARIVNKEWFFYSLWANLAQNVRSGQAALAPLTDRCSSAPDQVRVFLTALNDIAGMGAPGVLAAAGMPDEGSLLDFGGGMAGYATRIAAAHPALRVTLVDTPHVCGLCREHLEKVQMQDRIAVVEGDLFDLSPALGEQCFDVVFVSHIIHDYAPEEAEKLIASAARHVVPGGRLYLLDVPKPQPDGDTAEALFNVMMLVEAPGGRTHEGANIRKWLSTGDLELFNVSKLFFGTLYEARRV